MVLEKVAIFGIVCLLSFNSVLAAPRATPVQKAQKRLRQVYKKLQKNKKITFIANMKMLAKQAKESKMNDEAKIFRTLAKDKKSRDRIMKLLKANLKKDPESGIFYDIYLMYPQAWCYAGDRVCDLGIAALSLHNIEAVENFEF
jgi:hypothetical protein